MKTDIPDHDSRTREQKDGEYLLSAVVANGSILCCTPGVKLVDFYRSLGVLAKPEPQPKETK